MQRLIRAVRKFFTFSEPAVEESSVFNDASVGYEVVEINSSPVERRSALSSMDETFSESGPAFNPSKVTENDKPQYLLGMSPSCSRVREVAPGTAEFCTIKVASSSSSPDTRPAFAHLTGSVHTQFKRPSGLNQSDSLVLVQESGDLVPLITDELIRHMQQFSPDSPPSDSSSCADVDSFVKSVEHKFTQANSRVVHNVIEVKQIPWLPLLHKLFLQLTPSSAYTLVLVHSLDNKLKKTFDPSGYGVDSQSYLDEILELMTVVHSTVADSTSKPRVVLALDRKKRFKELCFGLSELEEVARGTFLKVMWEELMRALENSTKEMVHLDIREAAIDSAQGDFKQLTKRVLSKGTTHAKLPLRWTYLILFIKTYGRAHNKPVITYSNFLDFARVFSLSDKEAFDALQVYQDLGLLYRLCTQSSLQRYIFIDLRWFFESFSVLSLPSNPLSESLLREWQNARKTGKISRDMYQHIVEHTPISGGLPKNWLFNLLQQWHLVHESSKQGVFSPLFLPVTSRMDARASCERKSASAFYQFRTGSIPPSYLSRLATILRRRPGFSPLLSSSSSSSSFQLAVPHHPVAYHVKMSIWKGNLRLHLCSPGQRALPLRQLSYACDYLMEVIEAACRQLHDTWPNVNRSQRCSQILHLYLTCPCARFAPTTGEGRKHLALVLTKAEADSTVQCTVTERQYKLRTLPVAQRVWTHQSIEGLEPSSAPDRLSRALAANDDDCYDSDSDSEANSCQVLLQSLCSMSRSLLCTTMDDPTVSVLKDLEKDVHQKLDLESSVCRDLQEYGILDREQFTQVRVTAFGPRGWTRATASRGEARRNAIRLLLEGVRREGPRGYMALVAALTHHIKDSLSIEPGFFTRTYNYKHEELLNLLTLNQFFAVIRALWLESVIV